MIRPNYIKINIKENQMTKVYQMKSDILLMQDSNIEKKILMR
jgi:hypothetical protein